MSIESPKHNQPERCSELSPYERLMVASENVFDSIGNFRDGNEPFRDVRWDSDEDGHRFEFTCAQKGEMYYYTLKVIRQFSRNHVLEYYMFNNVLREVETCDESGKSLSSACDADKMATLFRYMQAATTEDESTNTDFMRLMNENGVRDPRLSARAKAFARSVLGLR